MGGSHPNTGDGKLVGVDVNNFTFDFTFRIVPTLVGENYFELLWVIVVVLRRLISRGAKKHLDLEWDKHCNCNSNNLYLSACLFVLVLEKAKVVRMIPPNS